MNRQKSLAVLLCAAVLAACNYEKNAVQDITAPDPGSRIRFFNFGVNAPAVNFYANDTKVTAVSSTTGIEATTGTGYGGVGLAGLYSALAPGQYTFTGRIAATIDKDLSISSVATTLTDGKYYSFYQSGFYNTTSKTVEAFVVEDPFPATIDYSVAYVRFVNAISNANPMTLYARNTTTATEVSVGAEVAYKGAGAFTSLPPGAYDLSTRYAGSTTNALTRPAVSFVAGRVYTITARGDITVAPSTACAAANRTCLDNTVNR
ncbi:MAG: DUF4397 domain-containing protein [Gemmatimonadota bacterium]|nr:DUF4397 domain-containing protein [Gemmatimonadota bacterium]